MYTLRLQKGFAKDSAGADLLPGRYTFRTKRDEDYGKLRIHLPTRYYGRTNILQVTNERDTIYQKPVTDSMVALLRIQPGVYTLRVIIDKNENGRWDAGDLFLRRQPEVVVPYTSNINLKAGWEQQIDFEAPRTRSLGLERDKPKVPGRCGSRRPGNDHRIYARQVASRSWSEAGPMQSHNTRSGFGFAQPSESCVGPELRRFQITYSSRPGGH